MLETEKTRGVKGDSGGKQKEADAINNGRMRIEFLIGPKKRHRLRSLREGKGGERRKTFSEKNKMGGRDIRKARREYVIRGGEVKTLIMS